PRPAPPPRYAGLIAWLPVSLDEEGDHLGDAGGALLALDFDRVVEDELGALRPADDVAHFGSPAQARADDDGLEEADLVESVVDLHRHALDGEDLGGELRDQSEGEEAVDDGRFVWALCRAGLVDVDPLVVV